MLGPSVKCSESGHSTRLQVSSAGLCAFGWSNPRRGPLEEEFRAPGQSEHEFGNGASLFNFCISVFCLAALQKGDFQLARVEQRRKELGMQLHDVFANLSHVEQRALLGISSQVEHHVLEPLAIYLAPRQQTQQPAAHTWLSQMSYCLLLLLQAHGNTGARGRQMPIKHVAGTHHHQGDGVDHQQHWGVTRKAPQEGAGPVSHPRPSGNHSPASSCNNDARADAGAGRQKLGQQLLDFRVALKRLHHRVAFANFLEAVVYLPSALRIANIASHFSPLSRRLAVLFCRARIPAQASRKRERE